jgi:hypothetical protein
VEDVPRLGVPLASLDLASIAAAIDDHDDLTVWWFDPATGAAIPSMDESVSGIEVDLDTTDLVEIESRSSRAAYLDRSDFAEAVADRSVRQRLERALEGRGAFRRFRDAIAAFPDLETPWHGFERLRSDCRALDWLELNDLGDPEEIEALRASRSASAASILADLRTGTGAGGALVIDRSELPDRWHEVAASIDAGESVQIKLGSSPWGRLVPIDSH